MAEIDGSRLHEVPKPVQPDVCGIETDAASVKLNLRSVKGHMASTTIDEIAQDTISADLLERAERIERHLDRAGS